MAPPTRDAYAPWVRKGSVKTHIASAGGFFEQKTDLVNIATVTEIHTTENNQYVNPDFQGKTKILDFHLKQTRVLVV